MPCYDARDSSEYRVEEARREFTHNSPVAEMLCALMKQIEAGRIEEVPEGLAEWWAAHKARDIREQQKKAEALKRNELAAKARETREREELARLKAKYE